MAMNKKEKEFMNKLVEENGNFRKLLKYTVKDLTDLAWDYDRMSTSGQQTYDRLSRMYAMKFEEKRNAISQ
tara:strand:+ start:3120 stop:3332 length:213 start_codon:yes stop_codon:yes gene_type:complete